MYVYIAIVRVRKNGVLSSFDRGCFASYASAAKCIAKSFLWEGRVHYTGNTETFYCCFDNLMYKHVEFDKMILTHATTCEKLTKICELYGDGEYVQDKDSTRDGWGWKIKHFELQD